MEVDILIMKYKTTLALLKVDRDFYLKNNEFLSARIATNKIELIEEFIEDLQKLNAS